jgi:hypothetical protein
MLRVGTLRDIFVASQNSDKPMVLNCLNLPMAHGGIFALPRFRSVFRAPDQFSDCSVLSVVTLHPTNLVGHRRLDQQGFRMHSHQQVILFGQPLGLLELPPGSMLMMTDSRRPRNF